MNNKRSFIIILLVLVLLLGGSYFAYDKLSDKVDADNISTNDQGADDNYVYAMDFTVYDIDGNEVHLSDFLGKPVVVNFWASWCYPCKMEMPDFNAAYKEYEGEVVFMMVNMTDGVDETVESASEFIASTDYEFPIYYDTDMDAAMKYGVYSIPTTYFINSKGQLIGRGTSALSLDILHEAIGAILD